MSLKLYGCVNAPFFIGMGIKKFSHINLIRFLRFYKLISKILSVRIFLSQKTHIKEETRLQRVKI